MNLLSYLTKQLKNVLTEIHAGKQTHKEHSTGTNRSGTDSV